MSVITYKLRIMNAIYSLTKKIGVGTLVLGLATTVSLLPNQKPVQAALLTFDLDGDFAAGGDLTGSFIYDTVNSEITDWDFLSGSFAGELATGDAVTYDQTTSAFTTNNSNNFVLSYNTGLLDPGETLVLDLGFLSGLDGLTLPGSSTTLIAGTTAPTSSYAKYDRGTIVSFTDTITGGVVTVAAVPEPLTIVGTFMALGAGVAMKKKQQEA